MGKSTVEGKRNGKDHIFSVRVTRMRKYHDNFLMLADTVSLHCMQHGYTGITEVELREGPLIPPEGTYQKNVFFGLSKGLPILNMTTFDVKLENPFPINACALCATYISKTCAIGDCSQLNDRSRLVVT